ncbi:hypothetical protein C0993_012743 [Termitomyces sp. T159_Od127]|nr:hypothetical protein C0993_012743 [Termitomyces sp. T159_Od127]
MSITIVVAQRPTFFLQPYYCMRTCTLILSGFLAILLLWFALTLAFIKPPVREVLSRPHSKLQSGSSSSTTAVDPISKDVINKRTISSNKEQGSHIPLEDEPECTTSTENGSKHFIIIANPFSNAAAAVKVSTSASLALYPFVRRMSMPRHRTSICIRATSPSDTVASLPKRATVYRHGSLAEDNSSYLPPPHVPSGKVRLVSDDGDKDQSVKCISPAQEFKTTKLDSSFSAQPKKTTKFKRVRRRVREFFHKSPTS